jgi:hypothetical protein
MTPRTPVDKLYLKREPNQRVYRLHVPQQTRAKKQIRTTPWRSQSQSLHTPQDGGIEKAKKGLRNNWISHTF